MFRVGRHCCQEPSEGSCLEMVRSADDLYGHQISEWGLNHVA